MSDPFANLLPDQRRRASAERMAAQWDRPTYYDQAPVERAGLLPLGTYPNGQTGLAFPGFVTEPIESWNRMYTAAHAGEKPSAEDAFNVAGAAMVGGFAAPKPTNTLGTFGGRMAKTADQAALTKAEEMASQGIPSEQIWNNTGWFKGVDGKWRFEIDDSGLRTIENKDGGRGIGTNESAIKHPQFASAYPTQAANIDVALQRGKYGGGFDPERNSISASGASDAERRSIVGHELQHVLQNTEGFAGGANPDSIWTTDLMRAENFLKNATGPQGDTLRSLVAKAEAAGQKVQAMRELAYRMHAGEVESRAVEKRLDMTPEERRARPPWLDYDVPEDQQIVRNALYANGGRSGAATGTVLGSAGGKISDRPVMWHGGAVPVGETPTVAHPGKLNETGNSVFFAPHRGDSSAYAGPTGTVQPFELSPTNTFVWDVDNLPDTWNRLGQHWQGKAGAETWHGPNAPGIFDALRKGGYDSIDLRLGGKTSEFGMLEDGKSRLLSPDEQGLPPSYVSRRNTVFANGGRSGAAAGTAVNALADQPTGIRAYHGSPHDFDRFDLSKIGTGEGAQAYGHGLYFAENEGVARSYRDALKANTRVGAESLDSAAKAISDAVGASGPLTYEPIGGNLFMVYEETKPAGFLKKGQRRSIGTVEEITHTISGSKKYYPHSNEPGALAKLENHGRMYEVNIKANPEDFLDWDKPLSQQSEKVRGALGNEGMGQDGYYRAAQYQRQGQRTGDPLADLAFDMPVTDHPKAAAALREAGIPGIRYFDQGSRNAGQGTSNYVVFDDSLVDILRKYGLAGLTAGGAATNLLGQAPGQHPQQSQPWWNQMIPGDA